MKVIVNRHRFDSKKATRVRCQQCTSTLEVTKDDLSFIADSRDGNAYTFKCPCCDHVNWVAASIIDHKERTL